MSYKYFFSTWSLILEDDAFLAYDAQEIQTHLLDLVAEADDLLYQIIVRNLAESRGAGGHHRESLKELKTNRGCWS